MSWNSWKFQVQRPTIPDKHVPRDKHGSEQDSLNYCAAPSITQENQNPSRAQPPHSNPLNEEEQFNTKPSNKRDKFIFSRHR